MKTIGIILAGLLILFNIEYIKYQNQTGDKSLQGFMEALKNKYWDKQ